MSNLVHDFGYALRSFRKRPGFSAIVVATLAFGMAAATVVVSLVDGLVLNPFPYPDGDRLVGVGTEYPRLRPELGFFENLSAHEYLDIAEGVGQLERVVAWDMGNRQVTVGDETENLFSAFWFGDAFPTLGVDPILGRGFSEDELVSGARVAILSHRVWRTRFGGDRSLIGGTVLVNGDPYTVIGIMPPRTLIYGTDLWLPMGVSPNVFRRNRRQFQVMARLAPGSTLAQANTELDGLARRVEHAWGGEFAEYGGWRMQAMTWRDINVRTLRPAAFALVGAVAFVLLLVCANIASLMLARGAMRQREVAVRAALGAGRSRIASQLLVESLVLALAGGVAGVLLGTFAIRSIATLLASIAAPIPGEVALNGRVLTISGLIAALSGLVFGVVPAVHSARTDLQRVLQAESLAVVGGGSRLRLQRMFVGVEVALALALLTGSALLVASLLQLERVQPGFEPGNVLTMRLTLAWERYERSAIEPFFQDLRDRVGATPGVVSVATTSQLPPRVFSSRQFRVENRPVDGQTLPSAFATIVSPGYFDALRIPVRSGRVFTEADRAGTPWIMVINEELARRWFPGEDPVGQRILSADPDDPPMEIVGIVGSTRNRGLDQPVQPELYVSSLQASGWNNQMFLVVRTAGEPRSMLPAIRSAVQAIDAQQPVYAITTLDESFRAAQATRRISLAALSLFAVFALLLAAVGVYGVVAQAASRRTREIGVRMALGAERGQVRRLVVRQAMLPVVIGAAAGVGAAFGLGRLLTGLLFDVSGGGPTAFGGAVLIMLAAALLAAWIPARRASRLDPVRALRTE